MRNPSFVLPRRPHADSQLSHGRANGLYLQKRGKAMYRSAYLGLVFALTLAACASGGTPGAGALARPDRAAVTPVQAQDSYYVKAEAAVAARVAERGVRPARNVILFVGDGMGVSTVTAARIWAGQQQGLDGESYQLAMERLPWSAFSKTYTHDAQVADSAPTATAMVAGVKARNGTIGVTQGADVTRCGTAAANGTDTLWAMAERAGMATGVVTTTRLTHATPAATFARTVERDWEDDSQVSAAGKAAGCLDIAAQFLANPPGDGFEVALGGGRRQFLPATMADPEYPALTGGRQDGRNLIQEWRAAAPRRRVALDAADFAAIDWTGDEQVLGLFEPSHMQYELDRAADPAGEPSLKQMTEAAITRLSRNPRGYVLMVEAGRIDHAHHAGNAVRALADTVALDDAVAAALAMTDPRETLVIVTADHSHVFTIAGYPRRNNPILGLVREAAEAAAKAGDGKPYTTLGYANGPGAICAAGPEGGCLRPDLTMVDTHDHSFLQQATVPLPSETHGGEDVMVFAQGPGSELVSGVIEQNEIFHVMGKALGLVE